MTVLRRFSSASAARAGAHGIDKSITTIRAVHRFNKFMRTSRVPNIRHRRRYHGWSRGQRRWNDTPTPITCPHPPAKPGNRMRCFALWISLLCLFVTLSCVHAAEPKAFVANGAAVNLLAMGDWGYNGGKQKEVAVALADYVRTANTRFDGMLLAGDNF